MIGRVPKTARSFEEDAKLSAEDLARRGDAYQREAEAERDPETGRRPSVADRVKGAAESIVDHLPRPRG